MIRQCYSAPAISAREEPSNPDYQGVFSFVNDYSALLAGVATGSAGPASPLLVAEPARGLCKVICFHPEHSLTLARMTQP